MTAVKTDENLSGEAARLLRRHGVDAQSVVEEEMQGWGDPDVWKACCEEDRALITLDQDFGDQRAYPTGNTPGIVLLRPVSQMRSDVLRLIESTVVPLLEGEVSGRLWIVTDHAVRTR